MLGILLGRRREVWDDFEDEERRNEKLQIRRQSYRKKRSTSVRFEGLKPFPTRNLIAREGAFDERASPRCRRAEKCPSISRDNEYADPAAFTCALPALTWLLAYLAGERAG